MTTGTTVVGARVFDGREVQAETSVRFVGGLVTVCGARDVARDGDEVVDGTGWMLLPGLIDAHTHLLPGAPQQACTFGVTTELDMFSQPALVRRCKAEAAARLDVADVRSSGIGATAPGGHPSMMYAPFPTVTGPDDAEGFVADRIAEGSDYLKIIYEPGNGRFFTLPSLDFTTVRALARAAHDRGMVVVVHATSVAAFAGVVGSGVDVLTQNVTRLAAARGADPRRYRHTQPGDRARRQPASRVGTARRRRSHPAAGTAGRDLGPGAGLRAHRPGSDRVGQARGPRAGRR